MSPAAGPASAMYTENSANVWEMDEFHVVKGSENLSLRFFKHLFLSLFNLFFILPIKYVGNIGNGIIWDYHVDCGSFIDSGEQM